MQWINILDQLPKKGQEVLVWTSTGMCIAHICGTTVTGSEPTWMEPTGEYDFWGVTHWMSLPQPPEE